MGEFLSPGVYPEERASGQAPVTGVSTSNFAVVGWTPRGRSNLATLVTSFEQFVENFGSYTKYSDLAVVLTAFFSNDGRRAYVVRVVPADAVTATKTVPSHWKVDAASEGAWGNLVRLSISGNENYYNPATAEYSRFDVLVSEEVEDGQGVFDVKEQYEALVLDNVDHKDYITSVLNDQSQRVVLTDLSVSGGIPTVLKPTVITGAAVGTGTGSQQSFTTTLANPVIADGTVVIKNNGTDVAIDDGDGFFTGVGVSGQIDYNTGIMNIYFTVAPALNDAITANYIKKGVAEVNYDLENGSDGDPSSIGRNEISNTALQATNKGIYALGAVEEMLNVAIPDFSDDPTISLDVVAYAEQRKDLFGIFDCPANYTPQQALKYKRQTFGSLSSYGAIYYPKITIADPLKDGRPRNISAVGHIAGVFARTDNNKNVGKAPAGVEDGRLNFALGLERTLARGEMDLIYPSNINPLWISTATGRVVWGSRTMQVNGDFTQVNARRLFMYLEKSIFNSTHDVVFENIGPELWTRLKLRVEGFFFSHFEEGYFAGKRPEDAYQIVVDETNNPPEIQKQRMVIVDYYVAVNEPGEFIRHRFQRRYE